MNSARTEAVTQAFQMMDADSKGSLPLEFLKKKFSAKGHPRVRNREKTEETVQKEFEDSISQRLYCLLTS